MLKIPSISKEYLKVPATGPTSTLTALPVEMAILPEGQDPGGGDWQTAQWSTTGDAMILIGPGTSFALTKGAQYSIWVRVTASPEIPVLGPYGLHIT